MATDTNIIPQRPTFDNVFADWNNQHLARFGTYVNTATAGEGNYERQVQALKDQTAQEQAQWDATYGNTAAGKAISSNPPPTWQDSYNTWIKDYQKVFGTDQLNRPWSADADAAAQKQALDNDYLTSLDKYNKENGTNIAPQAGVLGANAQPNSFYKQPESNNGGLGGALASIDPGRAIGSIGNAIDKNVTQPVGKGFAQTDKFMTNLTPYGWALPAAIVAAYFTAGGSLAVEGAAEGAALAAEGAGAVGAAEGAGAIAAEAATTAGSEAFASGIAAGMSEAEATAIANAAADASLASSAGVESGAGLEALSTSSSAMGPTYGEMGYTGVEGGFAGPTYDEMGFTGLNQGEAIAQADSASQLAQLKDYASNAKDVYSNVNRAKNIANALTSGKTGTTQQSTNPQALASLLASPQEQFGGLYRMNEKPFLSTQQTASLSPDSYNVSGQNINSPIAPTNQLLANLLYPKA
jgi:hypothetical protein